MPIVTSNLNQNQSSNNIVEKNIIENEINKNFESLPLQLREELQLMEISIKDADGNTKSKSGEKIFKDLYKALIEVNSEQYDMLLETVPYANILMRDKSITPYPYPYPRTPPAALRRGRLGTACPPPPRRAPSRRRS